SHSDELQLAEDRERPLERVHDADLDRRLRGGGLRPAGRDPRRGETDRDHRGYQAPAHTSSVETRPWRADRSAGAGRVEGPPRAPAVIPLTRGKVPSPP